MGLLYPLLRTMLKVGQIVFLVYGFDGFKSKSFKLFQNKEDAEFYAQKLGRKYRKLLWLKDIKGEYYENLTGTLGMEEFYTFFSAYKNRRNAAVTIEELLQLNKEKKEFKKLLIEKYKVSYKDYYIAYKLSKNVKDFCFYTIKKPIFSSLKNQ